MTPFTLYIPLATKLRAFRLVTPRRAMIRDCSYCGKKCNVHDLDNQNTCYSCRINELGKGE